MISGLIGSLTFSFQTLKAIGLLVRVCTRLVPLLDLLGLLFGNPFQSAPHRSNEFLSNNLGAGNSYLDFRLKPPCFIPNLVIEP